MASYYHANDSKYPKLFIDSSRSSKPQRFHYRPTSRAGGLGIVLGIFTGFVLFGLVSSAWAYFLAASLVIFASGFLEDMHALYLARGFNLLYQCTLAHACRVS